MIKLDEQQPANYDDWLKKTGLDTENETDVTHPVTQGLGQEGLGDYDVKIPEN